MPVAVVTGANKGIGLSVARGLCKQFKGDVVLAARNEARGREAVSLLEKEGLHPKFHLLDINKNDTIIALRDFLVNNYGGVDVLVNNAGIASPQEFTRDKNPSEPIGDLAKETLATNYWGTKAVCESLFPILKPGARVVNMSSVAGFLGLIGRSGDEAKAGELKAILGSETLTREKLDQLMQNFVDTAMCGTQSQEGWPNSPYVVSKIGVSALSRVLQREVDLGDRKDILVNFVHPGFVATDMTQSALHIIPQTPLTPEQGALAGLYAALLPPGSNIKGAYIWEDCQIVDWVNGPLPVEPRLIAQK